MVRTEGLSFTIALWRCLSRVLAWIHMRFSWSVLRPHFCYLPELVYIPDKTRGILSQQAQCLPFYHDPSLILTSPGVYLKFGNNTASSASLDTQTDHASPHYNSSFQHTCHPGSLVKSVFYSLKGPRCLTK